MTNQEITDLMIWEFYRKKFPYDEMTIRMANERIFYYSIEYLRQNNFLLAEINSITNEPEIAAGKILANKVRIGNNEFLNACFQNTFLGSSPFANAVRMKSCLSTLSILPLIILEINANAPSNIQNIGNAK